jgi:hypothetical protein
MVHRLQTQLHDSAQAQQVQEQVPPQCKQDQGFRGRRVEVLGCKGRLLVLVDLDSRVRRRWASRAEEDHRLGFHRKASLQEVHHVSLTFIPSTGMC